MNESLRHWFLGVMLPVLAGVFLAVVTAIGVVSVSAQTSSTATPVDGPQVPYGSRVPATR
jgi:hypothetical protein